LEGTAICHRTRGSRPRYPNANAAISNVCTILLKSPSSLSLSLASCSTSTPASSQRSTVCIAPVASHTGILLMQKKEGAALRPDRTHSDSPPYSGTDWCNWRTPGLATKEAASRGCFMVSPCCPASVGPADCYHQWPFTGSATGLITTKALRSGV
jgi:hypothetical protein